MERHWTYSRCRRKTVEQGKLFFFLKKLVPFMWQGTYVPIITNIEKLFPRIPPPLPPVAWLVSLPWILQSKLDIWVVRLLFWVWAHRQSTSNSLNKLQVRIFQILWTKSIPVLKQPNSTTLHFRESLSSLMFYCLVLQLSCLPSPFCPGHTWARRQMFVHC